jgi:hypothetical protein
VNPAIDFGNSFTYDASLTPAQNLTAFKNAVIAAAAAIGFPGMVATNILVDIAMN